MGTELTDWHSGYRAYSVPALESIAFEENSNGLDFDTQVIVQLHDAGKPIIEAPIPTYYGDELSSVRGLEYARDVVRATLGYRLQKMGLRHRDRRRPVRHSIPTTPTRAPRPRSSDGSRAVSRPGSSMSGPTSGSRDGCGSSGTR